MAEDMHHRKWSGHNPVVARDAIIDHLGGVWPSLIDSAGSWPDVQASRTENFDAFVADEVLKGLINWLRSVSTQTESEIISKFLLMQAAAIEADLAERGLVEV